MKRTIENVMEEIRMFLTGRGGAHNWDDFLSIPIHDLTLNAIRMECAELREKYPPGACLEYCGEEGIRRLKEIVGISATALGSSSRLSYRS